ncbi:hypothetical protein MUK42_34692 [Musa troglodytarum]|uniref:Superoxide dismutase copper/zinc binding domain-containing protein n=1 Tax=Musa troglodytarum TaxID=320322 RepID=A0A9E7H700_9LILI|nr:hypothetical protein MUK42_34692 [Musa troglodytarum]
MTSKGPHFNPTGDHGDREVPVGHFGDLGNVIAGDDGTANLTMLDSKMALIGSDSIIGRAIVVHADPDDLGWGGHELGKTTGNSGARVACGKYSTVLPQSLVLSLFLVLLV